MKFAIIAPPTQTKKWEIEFHKQAPNEEVLIGYETDKPKNLRILNLFFLWELGWITF